MQEKRSLILYIVLRIVIAVFFGGVVAGMALQAGWDQARSSNIMYPQEETQRTLKSLNEAIALYRQHKHALPRTLGQLADVQASADMINIDEGKIYDAWGHPFVYSVQGDHYLVASYGADGKPGGTGLDIDLTSDNITPRGARLTFHQFLTHPATKAMVTTAYLTGALAGTLCFGLVIPVKFTRKSAVPLIIAFWAVLVAATMVASFITMLHIPTGH